jgi:acetoacetyl-CoA reductase/3-oxoacyl-[acyl-carrier protein] reductase
MKIITGASKGIGKYLLERYTDRCSEIVRGTFLYTDPPLELSKFYSKVDITKYESVEDWIQNDILIIGCEFPVRIDLINCAGISYSSFAHVGDPAIWDTIIGINLTGTFNVIRAVLPAMRKAKYGRIINMSSVVDRLGVAGTSAYAASKAGLEGLAKVIAVENGSMGITINNLRLGYFDIGMGSKISPSLKVNIDERIPTHRFGDPKTILNAIDFLIDNPYINGSSLTIDGGLA